MIAETTISDVTLIIGAVVTGIVTIIGAIVTGVLAIRNSQKAADKKLDVIHDLTNNNLTEIKGNLKAAAQEILGLKEALKVQKERSVEQQAELAKAPPPAPPIPKL